MEKDCHNCSADRYIKVNKGNVLFYGLFKVSAIPFHPLMIDFIVVLGLILRLGCWIVIVISEMSLYRGSLNRGFVPYIILKHWSG